MAEKMENVGYSTVYEIIYDILQVLSPEYQETIKEMSKDDFRDIEHFNLGQWIRNKYFYQNPAQEQVVKSLDDLKEYMFHDENEFSRMILEKLYEKITTEKNNMWIDNKGVKKIGKIDFSTIDEIIDDILKTLPSDFQKKIKEITVEDFIIEQHFSLGIWIRNKYFHQNPMKEQLIANLGYQKDYKFLDGDRFSHIILRKLYEKITTEIKQQP